MAEVTVEIWDNGDWRIWDNGDWRTRFLVGTCKASGGRIMNMAAKIKLLQPVLC